MAPSTKPCSFVVTTGILLGWCLLLGMPQAARGQQAPPPSPPPPPSRGFLKVVVQLSGVTAATLSQSEPQYCAGLAAATGVDAALISVAQLIDVPASSSGVPGRG